MGVREYSEDLDETAFGFGGDFSGPGLTEPEPQPKRLSASDLQLVPKRIPIRYCEYKIGNNPNKMLQGETLAASHLGLQFFSPIHYPVGCLMRIWVDMPDYWARKSRMVSYRHTNAPSYFQVLARVVNAEEQTRRTGRWQSLVEIVNLDKVDEAVLCEYLGIPYQSPSRDSQP